MKREIIIMTNNIFDLFNLVDEKEAEKREEEAKAKAILEEEKAKALAEVQRTANVLSDTIQKELIDPSNKKLEKESTATVAEKAKAKATEAPKFEPNEDTVIRFYGESIQISAYFSAEELAEGQLVKKKDETQRIPLTEELLRKRMEKDYPELVKDFTEIIFIPAKNLIVPMIKAKKKGCIQEEVSSSTDDASSFPKIPHSMLESFITLAKTYAKYNLEVHADVYFRPETNDYFLDIPEQTVHQYWVEVTEEGFSIVSRVLDAVKVLEIHSHHDMMAFPSTQDNASERVPGMHYAIVGNVNRYYPDVFLRQFISDEIGHSIKKVEEVFESPFQALPSFDANVIEVSAK